MPCGTIPELPNSNEKSPKETLPKPDPEVPSNGWNLQIPGDSCCSAPQPSAELNIAPGIPRTDVAAWNAELLRDDGRRALDDAWRRIWPTMEFYERARTILREIEELVGASRERLSETKELLTRLET